MRRAAGMLLHISSLPQAYGIGTFGSEAYAFGEVLRQAGMGYWQLLPLGPTGYGDSPYQSFSAFAINPYFIDLQTLCDQGLLTGEELAGTDFGRDPFRVDYGALYEGRFAILEKAFCRFSQRGGEEREKAEAFYRKEKHWLEDYALFMAIKEAREGKPWYQWEEPLRRREPEALEDARRSLSRQIGFWRFLQYQAFSQWERLKAYINGLGICFIGDLPFYAAHDSADVWANAAAGLFRFTGDLEPAFVAGCPPDYFSAEGQYWGNPVYDWESLRERDYGWWLERMGKALELYDMVRIDHFRGLESYWEIPRQAPGAAWGHWSPGPGMELMEKIRKRFGGERLIAEDLGLLTPSCREFIKKSGCPGMRVLSFAFDSDAKNEHLPHHYEKQTVAYTATHDNDTIIGWWEGASPHQRQMARRYLGLTRQEGINRGMIRGVWSSCAGLAIAPLQDVLGVGREGRMNFPSRPEGNWQWRFKKEQINQEWISWLGELNRIYDR